MEKIKKININKFMYVIFGIYMLDLILTNTVLPNISDLFNITLKLIRYICYLVFATKIVFDLKEEKRITIVMIIFFAISILSFMFSHNKSVLFLFLALMALRKLNIETLLKIAYNVLLLTFFFIVTLSLLNIIPDWTFSRGPIIRHSLGFIYATDCIGVYLAIVLLYFYIKRLNAPITEIMVLELTNVFLYKYTNGRLSFILITIILGILALSKMEILRKILNSKPIQRVTKIMCYTLPIILFVFYNFLTYAYYNNNDTAKKIDELLSGRLRYTAKAYEEYKVPLFGKDIDWNGWGGYGYVDTDEMDDFEYNFVDSSYAKLIFDFGIIYTILIILAYIYCLVNNYNQNNYWAVISVFFVLIWSFIEPYLISLGRNPLTLLLIPVLEIGMVNLNIKKRSNVNIALKNKI